MCLESASAAKAAVENGLLSQRRSAAPPKIKVANEFFSSLLEITKWVRTERRIQLWACGLCAGFFFGAGLALAIFTSKLTGRFFGG